MPYGVVMFASITSIALVGVEPRPVKVEVHIGGAKAMLVIVGLPDAAVREAKERVQAALASSGFTFPQRRVVVNLSPADLPKAGSAYDLPIALGLLAATRQLEIGASDVVALGELALDGSVRPALGTLGAALVAGDLGLRCILPAGAVGVTSVLDRVDIAVASTLNEAVVAARGGDTGRTLATAPPVTAPSVDLAEIRGQPAARRCLEIAAAGGHHLLMAGSPGAGKTMLARALPGLLPPLDPDQVLEVALAWSAASLDRSGDVPPFRAPHHSATVPAIIGGGSGIPVPGEITLAHARVTKAPMARRARSRGRWSHGSSDDRSPHGRAAAHCRRGRPDVRRRNRLRTVAGDTTNPAIGREIASERLCSGGSKKRPRTVGAVGGTDHDTMEVVAMDNTSTTIAETVERWTTAREARQTAQDQHGVTSDEAVTAASSGYEIEMEAIERAVDEAITRCGRPVTAIEREVIVNEAHEAFEVAGGDVADDPAVWGRAIAAAGVAADRLVRHEARLWALAAVMLEELLLDQDPDPETSVSVKVTRGVVELLAPIYRARHPEVAHRFTFDVNEAGKTIGR